MSERSDSETIREEKTLSKGLGWKIALPVALGLGVVAWLFYDDFKPEVWRSIRWDAHVFVGLALALLFVAGRDYGITWRFRVLTDRGLSWRACLRVCMLCEFTSAITPSAVGGSALGMIYLNREGVPFGRATTLMMTTILLDELFFTLLCPLVVLAVSNSALFGFSDGGFTIGLRAAFWIIYGVIVAWTALLFLGIIVAPESVRRALNALFRLRWLRRWHEGVARTADNMVETSRELRGRGPLWWGRAFAATAVSWCSRFLVVNMLFWAFVPAASQIAVFGRQFVVWVILMVTPTPGGAGVSEWLFTEYYGDLIGSAALALVIALMWRLLSYYIYLVVGAVILPSWLRKGFGGQRHKMK
ncbi:MAG: flippase-like domain-containing protein [Candidatus Amulumruptor caecigallinarius]|nr:flippase-like domain-containing protein [Candidatus Amulumruptor caecigallinarius]MCM1396140.1 flippase-like domain-containing protein [Candidatus Amulumruptor caecigallinarius]MCM1453860.1 flippase-like domain-containing protein [bacterium]